MFDIEQSTYFQSLLVPKIVDYVDNADEIDGCCRSGTVVLSPIHNGMDITIANALRRVLIGSFPGHAISAFHVEGVTYEFETIDGVMEDVIQIGLNIKQIRLNINLRNPVNEFIEVSVKGPCEFRAGMIEEMTSIKVVNKDQLICTINSDITLNFKFLISFGYNYLDASVLKKTLVKQHQLIYLDALFNPIQKVSYDFESIMVNNEDCKKLFLNIETDGSIDYKNAIKVAVEILHGQFSIFPNNAHGFDSAQRYPAFSSVGAPTDHLSDVVVSADGISYNMHLFKTLSEIDIPIRAHNAFVRANITYLGDLLKVPYKELILIPNLGRKSLETVASNIAKFGLKFDSPVEAWPPSDILSLRKQYEAKIVGASNNYKKKNNNSWV